MALPSAMSRKRGRPSPHQQFLVILDMNGVLLVRSGSKKSAQLRPHVEELLETLWRLRDCVAVAVWSSMAWKNLEPLVHRVFGEKAGDLSFVWDQNRCTQCRVAGMHKPLLRKDLARLRNTPWAGYAPDHLLLVDDDPIKCTQNPAGTAVHPSSFTGVADGDSELLRLAAYIEVIAACSTNSVRQFVLSQPYEAFQEDEPAEEAPVEPPAKRFRPVGKQPRSHAAEACADFGAVEVFSEEWDFWFPAKVLEAFSDGSMRICWEGDETADYIVPPEAVRATQPEPEGGDKPWVRVESRTQPGAYYYRNTLTGETQLEPPEPWERVESRTRAGVYYFWNRVTGLTSVEKPDLSVDAS